MAGHLTARQAKFIDGVVLGISCADSYGQAGYSVNNMTQEEIAKKADRLSKQEKVAQCILQQKRELANSAIWGREQALAMIVEVALTAKKYMVTTKKQKDTKTGEETEIDCFDTATANSLAKAIEQANKMCGYNEPDKVDVLGTGFEVIITNAVKRLEETRQEEK